MKYVVLKMDGSKEILERTEPLPLEDMQKLVGGYIEAVRFSADSDFMMMVNEDGLQLKLAANPHCLGIVGNVVIGKMSGSEFVGLSEAELSLLKPVCR